MCSLTNVCLGVLIRVVLCHAGGEGTEPDNQTEQEGLIVRINIFGFDVVCVSRSREFAPNRSVSMERCGPGKRPINWKMRFLTCQVKHKRCFEGKLNQRRRPQHLINGRGFKM